MKAFAHRLIEDRSGAAAPTIALTLVALIAAGGIAFDYSRMASVDTELQNAADQAALAAATQLDGEPGACQRAADAARALITNFTLMANDGSTPEITVASETSCDASGLVRFYQDRGKTTAATGDANANFVEVTVNSRRANFAFTPIVGAFTSGDLQATAFAGLDTAVCKVPPVMMCNPNESGDPDFTVANYVGRGIRLVANDGGGGYGPGNFGFLETGAGSGANVLSQALGRNGQPGNCVPGTGVTTEPGNMVSVRDALNVRFDVFANGLNQTCGNNGQLCPPSTNSRKDVVREGTGGNSCRYTTGGGQGWKEPVNSYPNLPTTTIPRPLTDAEVGALPPMGYPRDICHAFSITGSCTANRIGDGNWDRYAYFRSNSVNYPALNTLAAVNAFMTLTFGTLTPTRYQVYQYEMNNSATRLNPHTTPAGRISHGRPVCTPPGLGPGPNQVDRRVLTIAVINCTAEGISGRTPNVNVTRWIDGFLTEPSVSRTRTEASDVYIEVIRETQNANDAGSVQLVQKSVPNLIE